MWRSSKDRPRPRDAAARGGSPPGVTPRIAGKPRMGTVPGDVAEHRGPEMTPHGIAGLPGGNRPVTQGR
jgi:hypothetical protein